MNLRTFNVLMWFNRPIVQAAIIGLALLLIAPLASALQLINIHSDGCHYCRAFQSEVGDSGYGANAISHDVPMVTVDIEKDYPSWYEQARGDGRIHDIEYTPTFILVDDDNNEVGRFIGYKNPEWFFGKVNKLVSDHQ